MRYPTDNHRATSRYGRRILNINNVKKMDYHTGQDYGCFNPNIPTNDPIYAIADGTVRVAKNNPGGYGNYVVIEHDGYCSLYAHLHNFNVKIGEVLKEGDVIGRMGKTGGTNAIHLHFEIRDVPYSRFWTKWEDVVSNGDGEYYFCVNPEVFMASHMQKKEELCEHVKILVKKLNAIYK